MYTALTCVESDADRLAIKLAFTINAEVTNGRSYLQKGVFVGDIYASASKIEPPREPESAAKLVHLWRDAVLEEIHRVLCTKGGRRKKLTGAIKHNVDILVTMIAASVATHSRIAIPVAAALVAALLRFVFSIGTSVFCKRFKTGLLFES